MSNTDPFYGQAPSQIGPYSHAVAITPSDTAPNFTIPFRAIYVGGAGNIKLMSRDTGRAGGAAVTLTGVQAGTILPVWTIAVLAAGTTATNLIGLY